jgi:hypothetical protein
LLNVLLCSEFFRPFFDASSRQMNFSSIKKTSARLLKTSQASLSIRKQYFPMFYHFSSSVNHSAMLHNQTIFEFCFQSAISFQPSANVLQSSSALINATSSEIPKTPSQTLPSHFYKQQKISQSLSFPIGLTRVNLFSYFLFAPRWKVRQSVSKFTFCKANIFISGEDTYKLNQLLRMILG